MFDDNFVPLSPLPFFQVQINCLYLDPKNGTEDIKKKEYQLPSFEKFTHEIPFADLNMGWNEKGLYFYCQVHSSFQDVFYPEISRGDSLELFIDTRDVKTSGFATKFCHHFYFLPQKIEEHQAGEMTRFRTEDAHELCDSKELKLKSDIQKKGYTLNIFIPSQCLHGYDVNQFNRIGFTYRINRVAKPPQHFSVLSAEFKVEPQPSLWSSAILAKTNDSLRKSSKPKR